MTDRDDVLFHQYLLSESLRNTAETMFQKIDAMDGDRLLNTSPDALRDDFVERHQVECPVILDDQIQVDQARDVQMSPADPRFGWLGSNGTAVTYHVPFHGEAVLFKHRPSSFTMNPPHAKVQGAELLVTVVVYPGARGRSGRHRQGAIQCRACQDQVQPGGGAARRCDPQHQPGAESV